jgi:hypothetical protein
VANTLLTTSLITKEALRVLENNLTATKTINREYDSKFAVEGAKIGSSLNIRKPVRYIVSEGQALQLQDATETQATLTLEKQFHVDFQFSSFDLTLSIDDFSKRFVYPAIAALANKIDSYVLSFYKGIYQAVGTPGTTPNALLTYLQAGVKLNDSATPRDGMRSLILTPLQEATIVDALKGLFQQASAISQQYTSGQMGTAIGFDWHMDQNLPAHTYGTYGGTPLVNGASQVGSTLITDGWTATTTILNEGDIFTIAGVLAVNPQSRQSTGSLQQFAVTAATVTDGSGNSTISITPPIVISGPFQNVTAAPADNAAITVAGASTTVSPQGMAWHRDAMTFATADLVLPGGTDMAARVSDKQLGISLRLIRDYDITTDQYPTRIDVLCGALLLRPEMAARVQG